MALNFPDGEVAVFQCRHEGVGILGQIVRRFVSAAGRVQVDDLYCETQMVGHGYHFEGVGGRGRAYSFMGEGFLEVRPTPRQACPPS